MKWRRMTFRLQTPCCETSLCACAVDQAILNLLWFLRELSQRNSVAQRKKCKSASLKPFAGWFVLISILKNSWKRFYGHQGKVCSAWFAWFLCRCVLREKKPASEKWCFQVVFFVCHFPAEGSCFLNTSVESRWLFSGGNSKYTRCFSISRATETTVDWRHPEMTKLSKLPDEEKIRICRVYFLLGFAFLPLVWLINFVWFFGEAFRRQDYNPKIRSYVIMSGVGGLIYTAMFVTWVVVYQTQHESFGEAAWKMAMNIPNGEV